MKQKIVFYLIGLALLGFLSLPVEAQTTYKLIWSDEFHVDGRPDTHLFSYFSILPWGGDDKRVEPLMGTRCPFATK